MDTQTKSIEELAATILHEDAVLKALAEQIVDIDGVEIFGRVVSVAASWWKWRGLP